MADTDIALQTFAELGNIIAEKKLTEYFLDSDCTKYVCQYLKDELGVPTYVTTLVLKIAVPYAINAGGGAFSWLGKGLLNKLSQKAASGLAKIPLCNKAIKGITARLDGFTEWLDTRKTAERLLKGDEEFHKSLSWDMAAHLRELASLDALEETQQDGFASMLEELDEIKGLLRKQPNLIHDLCLMHGQACWRSRFTYKSRFMPFVGRQDAMEHLRAFLEQKEMLSWEIITGAGGTGKSRLALELCLKYGNLWQAGKLAESDLKNFSWGEWQPERPTLLVVDYAGRYPNETQRMLRTLLTHSENGKLVHPVRLLLLERDARNDLETSWYRQFQGGEADNFEHHRFNSIEQGLEPYELSALEQKDLQTIIEHYALTRPEGQEPAISVEEMPQAQEAFFTDLDDQFHRPLFAALYGDALGAHGQGRKWDHTALLKDVVGRELRIWDERCKRSPDSEQALQDRNLVALATMTGGLEWQRFNKTNPELKNDFPQDPQAIRRYALLCGSKECDLSKPLPTWEPDLLGEFFVLEHFRQNHDLNPIPKFRDAAWLHNPKNMCDFLFRAFTDYFSKESFVPTIENLVQCPKSELTNNNHHEWELVHHYWGIFILRVSMPIGTKGEYSTYYTMFQDQFNTNNIYIQRGYCGSMYNFGVFQNLQNNYTEALSTYSRCISKFSRSSLIDIRIIVAKAKINISLILSKLGQINKAIDTYKDCIDSYYDENIIEFHETIATAMFNIGTLFNIKKNYNAEAFIYKECIKKFNSSHNTKIKKIVAKTQINLGNALGSMNKIADEVKIYNDCITENINSTIPEIQEIVLTAMINLAVAEYNNKNIKTAIETFQKCTETYKNLSTLKSQELIALAMLFTGNVLYESGNTTSAVQVFKECISRFNHHTDTAIASITTNALITTHLIENIEKHKQSQVEAYKNAIYTVLKSYKPEMTDQLISSMLNLQLLQYNNRDRNAAICTLETILLNFPSSEILETREKIAKSMVTLGILYAGKNNMHKAIESFQNCIISFRQTNEAIIAQHPAKSLYNIGAIYYFLHNYDFAYLHLYNCIQTFGSSEYPEIQKTILMSRSLLSNLTHPFFSYLPTNLLPNSS